MKFFLSICLFISATVLKGQDWCTNEPYKPENSYKNHADRFTHSNKPKTVEMGEMLIESVIIFRNEYLHGLESYNEPVISNNVYSNHRIRYSFINDLDFNISFNDLVVYTGSEVTKYGGPSPYSRVSIGAKYLVYDSRQKIALNGQLVLPRKALGLKMSPEFRVLYSFDIWRRLSTIINIGGYFFDKENAFFMYSLELDWYVSKRTMLLTEFYKNCSHLSVFSNISHFVLFGIGNNVNDNIFWYLTYENDFYKPKRLNKGRINMGFTYAIK